MTDSGDSARRGVENEEQDDALRVPSSHGQDNTDRLNSANATSSRLSGANADNYGDGGGGGGRRNHVWVHPSSGYLNAESYFPPTHPFAQRQAAGHRNGNMSFGYRPFAGSVGAPSYVNPFPRRGIGTAPSHVYPSPPHMDSPVYLYQQQQRQQNLPVHRGIRQDPSMYAARGRDVYSYGPRAFFPIGEPSAPSSSSLGSCSQATNEAIDHLAASSAPQKALSVQEDTKPPHVSTSNEGSSETESIEPPSENPVGTTPIFHPLPSMFNPYPRPLAFPINSRNKELPTLALFQNCSLESKVVGDYSDSHQELSLMLALPGLSTHQAPLLSLQQAGDILQTINNPLVVLKVGRLTRKLVPDPASLKPTDDVGTLALWLSPTSDVRLFWHSFLKGPASDSARDVEEQFVQLRSQGEGSPYKELFSHVELSEELAWVAAESDQVDGGSGIRLEMMKHDPSGRSFKLTRKKAHDRQKTELASKLATEERTTGVHLTEENRKLRDLLEQCMSEDPEEEDSYFFWIAESSVSEGMQMLNTMQRRLDHLPTLASESGVPEKKLQELYDWFSKAQQAASSDSTLSNEIASWIDLRSGASVPSQLFSNTCPANVPNWAESQPSSSSEIVEESPGENTIREGCALSATANFLVADKKWGLTHLATASVMVVVGVESTGLFYDEEKAHLDLSHCAHELAKKRAEAGASAEAERLGRIRLEELVAVKSLKEMRSNKTEARASASQPKTEFQNVSSQSEELIQKQQQAMIQSMQDRSGQRRLPIQTTYPAWGGPYIVPGQSIQGNAVMHHSHVYANPDVMTHMPDSFRQHVHYGVPMDHPASAYQPWKHDHNEAVGGGGNIQVMAPNQQYDHPSWSVPTPFHSYPWPYGDSAPPPPHPIPMPAVYRRPFVLSPTPPAAVPSFRPRHLPPQLPYLQVAHMHNGGGRRHNKPNMSLVRIAKEAIEKVSRDPRDRVRAGPSGSNLAATNINIDRDQDDVAYAWHDPAHQLGTLYRNTSLNVARMPDGDSVGEARTHTETPRNTTAEDAD